MSETQSQNIRKQIKELLSEHTSMEQERLLESVDAPNERVLEEIRKLIDHGKLCYNIEWEIDGRGKDYTDGLTV